MYAFSHISPFSLTSRSPKTRPKTRVILPKRPKPKKPKKGRPVQSLDEGHKRKLVLGGRLDGWDISLLFADGSAEVK